MSSVKTMLLRFEKNVTWKTPILFNSFFYSQVVTHWKLRNLLQNILWNFRYLLISCYFIFTSTKLFIYLNYVNFSDKQLSREDKKIFYLLKSKLVQVKRYREQQSQMMELSRSLKKLTRTISFTLRKTLLNKTSTILSKILIAKNVLLGFKVIRTIFPGILFSVKEGYVGKKYVRNTPKTLRYIKSTLWNSIDFNTANIPTSLYWSSAKSSFLGRLLAPKKPDTKKNKLNRIRTTFVKSDVKLQEKKLLMLKQLYQNKTSWLATKKIHVKLKLKKALTLRTFFQRALPKATVLTKVLYTVVPSLQKQNTISNFFLNFKFNKKVINTTKATSDLVKKASPQNFIDRLIGRTEIYFWRKHKRNSIANWTEHQTQNIDYATNVRYQYNLYKLLHIKGALRTFYKLWLTKKHINLKKVKPSLVNNFTRTFCTQSVMPEAITLEDYLAEADKSFSSGETFKTNKGLEFIYELHSKSILAYAKTYQDFSAPKSFAKKLNKNKKVKASRYTISRIKTTFLNKLISDIIKKTCLIQTAVVSQNIMYSKIAHLLNLYNRQILQSLPQQYSSYFYYKDLTNILVCALTLRCSSLLSFYLARLYEHVPKHSVIFHVFNRVFAVFKFYCKAPLSLRVLVKGRVNRRLRKHTVCLIQTQVSTSAIRSAMDYSLSHSFTGASVLGIKVWVISFSKSVAVKTFAQRYRVY